MVRWKPGAPDRLQLAALELFEEAGYDRTTVADIAARAGLTERTFYRYFTDKREVLMAGSEQLADRMSRAIAEAPASASPVDAVMAGVEAAGEMFDRVRAFSLRRQAVIAATPALMEREALKLRTLTEVFADALGARGVPDPAAAMTAQLGITVFHQTFARWIQHGDPAPGFAEVARATVNELRALMGG